MLSKYTRHLLCEKVWNSELFKLNIGVSCIKLNIGVSRIKLNIGVSHIVTIYIDIMERKYKTIFKETCNSLEK